MNSIAFSAFDVDLPKPAISECDDCRVVRRENWRMKSGIVSDLSSRPCFRITNPDRPAYLQICQGRVFLAWVGGDARDAEDLFPEVLGWGWRRNRDREAGDEDGRCLHFNGTMTMRSTGSYLTIRLLAWVFFTASLHESTIIAWSRTEKSACTPTSSSNPGLRLLLRSRRCEWSVQAPAQTCSNADLATAVRPAFSRRQVFRARQRRYGDRTLGSSDPADCIRRSLLRPSPGPRSQHSVSLTHSSKPR